MTGLPFHGRVQLDTNCCVTCFNDPWMREYIRAESNRMGQCDYCGSRRRRLVPIGELAHYFHNLMTMYEDSGDGDSLINAVQDEWYIFSDRLHESGRSAELLEDILNSDWDDDSGEWPIRAHDPVGKRDVLPDLESWEMFCLDVHEDPDLEPEFGDVFEEDLGNATETLPPGKILCRARPGWDSKVDGRKQPFRGADIGAPPPASTPAGRANREGRPVLYCAEDEQTAVAEIRPARGYWVSTCRLRLRQETRILDLVDRIRVPNPFTEESLPWYVQFSYLLGSFSEALSTPLARRDDINDYLPSQKLCVYLERLGFAGVKYPSAVQEDGKNVVFFRPDVAEVLESRLVEVTSVQIGFHGR